MATQSSDGGRPKIPRNLSMSVIAQSVWQGEADSKSQTYFNPTQSVSAREYGVVEVANLTNLYDLVVIGGGPAGIAGAIKAAQMGRRAIVIDKPKFEAGILPNGLDLFFGGPTGLFSKALRDTAKNTNIAAMRAQFMDSDVIWKQITNSIIKLATRNSEGICRTLQRYNVDYVQGSAKLLGEDDPINLAALQTFENDLDDREDGVRTVSVTKAALRYTDRHVSEGRNCSITGTKVLISTGSKATRLRGIPFDQSHRVFDSDTINVLNFLPRSIVISGLGIIGIEFANIFRTLGADVTVVVRGSTEAAMKKLRMDMDVAAELLRLLKESGVHILEGTTIKEFESVPAPGDSKSLIKMALNDGSILESDIFFAATGRYPVGKNEEAALEMAGVKVADRGMVSTDKKTLETASRNVYAAGDILGPPALASSSAEQAQRAVSCMFGVHDDAAEGDGDAPLCIGVWTIPELGYYGATKEEAEKDGKKVVEGMVRFDECLRGRVFAPDGLLKLVVDEDSGEVLGVHLIGKESAELVHYGMALVKAKTTVAEILRTVYTAVTFHELFKEAALNANASMEFGVEWEQIFEALSAGMPLEGLTEEYLREEFDLIDDDDSGELDEDELRNLFTRVGVPISKRIISNLMRLSDLDGNGTIDWDEFQQIFVKFTGHKK